MALGCLSPDVSWPSPGLSLPPSPPLPHERALSGQTRSVSWEELLSLRLNYPGKGSLLSFSLWGVGVTEGWGGVMFPPGRGSRGTKGNLVGEGKAKTAEGWGPRVLVFSPDSDTQPPSPTPHLSPCLYSLLIADLLPPQFQALLPFTMKGLSLI